jgi:hypothetical protein
MFTYLIDLFRPGALKGTDNTNIRIMHNINRIAVILFVISLILIAVKLLR